LFPFIALPIICVALAASARWLAARARSRIAWEDRCAKCDYIVHGLPGAVCPECGADLRRPGAVRPPGITPARLGGDAVVACWTIAFGLAYWPIEAGWLGRADPIAVLEASRQLLHPESGAYESFHGEFKGEAYRGSLTTGVIELTLFRNGGYRARLTIDPITWAYRSSEGDVHLGGAGGFDRHALERWVAGYGVDVSDARVSEELTGVADTVRRNCLTWGLPPGFSQGSGSSSQLLRTANWVLVTRWSIGLIWLAGATWLWRRAHGCRPLFRTRRFDAAFGYAG
jgi:hypothetical protein